jgi:hypothetical protein
LYVLFFKFWTGSTISISLSCLSKCILFLALNLSYKKNGWF